MANTVKLAHRRAVMSLANLKMIVFLGEDVDLTIVAPRKPVAVQQRAGETYGLVVWPNIAETVLKKNDFDLIESHNGWTLPCFVKAHIWSISGEVLLETTVAPTAEALNKRKAASEPWRPGGYGWKPIRGHDGANIWARSRIWGVYK
ncbi:hypothetical protein [Novosphingobium sp.]|uniref:hypothetical protein n=1 Tax=Novosphingobium sp. TaxID=1874826 RepID=UPI00262F562F|nr:hypothetical protein [Novosphingobium sp.]